MIYSQDRDGIKECVFSETGEIEPFLWADLLNVDLQSKKNIERVLNITLPSSEEINDIELSNRLYCEDSTLYMTVSLITKSDTDTPEIHAVTFVLLPQHLVTIRYSDSIAFQKIHNSMRALQKKSYTALEILCILLEASIGRLADVIENIEKKINDMSKKLFQTSAESFDFQIMLQSIGKQGERVSKIHESSVSLGRMFSFILESLSSERQNDSHSQLIIFSKDITALNEHTAFLANRITFLLDATLGLINIEQNKIIKILSIVTVVFAPPMMISSIYGMNFHVMPELSWFWSYPLALCVMIGSSMFSYQYFRKKRWI